MKKTHVLPGLILITGLFLVLGACNPLTTDTAVLPDPDPLTSAEAMEGPINDTMSDEISDEISEDMAADSDEMTGQNRDDSMIEAEDKVVDEGDEEMAMKKDGMSEETMMTPSWFETTLIDARTSETFTISNLKGKVILVETLAMWCSNCLKQQGEVKALHEILGERDDFISIGIDIDPNENVKALKSYISDNGFDWRYAVAPKEVAREIGQLYGDQFLNPPSTPMLIIDRHGEVHLLPFGVKSAETILEALQPFLDGNM